MARDLPESILQYFCSDDAVDMNMFVDDCLCACRSHVTVRDGLLNVHGRPIFERLLIRGSLNLNGNADLQRLPDVLAVTGSIFLSDCPNLKVMPSEMYVGDSIYMDRVGIRDLPKTMKAGRKITMNECPNVLEITLGVQTECLDAVGCSKLKRIASGLTFHILDLSGSPIEEIPAGITIENELKLRNCIELAQISEGATVRYAIDVRGCDKLFTLPNSVQPVTAITDGMMIANDWVVAPRMSGEEASMCLGRKAIDAFPERHFKNLVRMQDAVVSVDTTEKGYRKSFAVGLLQSERRRPDGVLQKLLSKRRIEDSSLLKGTASQMRLK
jgi:hypothetical protein